MYQRARKLHGLMKDSVSFTSFVEEALDAYNVAINSLSLVNEKNSWILLPVTPESSREVIRYAFPCFYV